MDLQERQATDPAADQGPPKYPRVRRAHVVPRGYLSNFAIDDKLTMHLVEEPRGRLVSLQDAAVRRDFYSRTRPITGERIDDIEWSLSHLESGALPVLHAVRDLWPLGDENKGRLAALFGYQLIRGPRWMSWHAESTERWAEETRATQWEATDEQIGEVRDLLLSSTPRLTRMLSLGPKVASVIGSMHWSLVEFRSPLLATSDHPIVLWPAHERSRHPQPSRLGGGLLHTLEAVVPLSPTLALLMTWLDRHDDAQPLPGHRDHAARMNAFVIAEAEQQWFHAPGRNPPRASGLLLPLSAELHDGYDRSSAAASVRRAEIERRIQLRIGSNDLNQDFELVSVG